jgi:methyl-accepting chemotaxis protein
MNWMDNITIKSRLLGTFGLVLAMLVGIIALSTRNGLQSLTEVETIVDKEFVKFQLAAQIDSATKSNARNTLELFVTPPEARVQVRQRMQQAKQQIDGLFQQLDNMLYLPEGRQLFDEAKAKRLVYVEAFTAAAKALEEQGPEAGQQKLQTQVLPALDALALPIERLMQFQQKVAEKRGHAVQAGIGQQINWSVGLGLFAVLLGMSSAWVLMRSITKPLSVAMQVTQAIAKGDLTLDFEVHGKNELSAVMESLHHMKENLSHVLMRIQESANSVANASTQIAAANLDLSSRTEEQASALEETAATMEELTSTVQSNATTTGQAHQMAEKACGSAREVGGLVNHVVSTMHDIHASSQRIRDIVTVIDSIAFQTNILALNAAVEAARAGDQGRGFAVVASEVRALAQRSATAAQEIKGIIEDNVAKMTVGNEQANLAGEAVALAVQSIESVNQTIYEVDVASKEQSSGIGQVGEAVAQMDTVTQQNAALVEETAAATKHLDEQVQGLKAALNRFTIRPSNPTAFQRLTVTDGTFT